MPKCCDHGPARSDITLKVSAMACGHCKEAVERLVYCPELPKLKQK